MKKKTISQFIRPGKPCFNALYFTFFVILIILFISTTNVYSKQITVLWDQNTETDLGGYIVYSGTSSENYDNVVDVGNQTSYTISNLVEGETYYFVVTAYDELKNESNYSTELVYAPPFIADPIGHWSFDEGSGVVAGDSSVNGNNASVEGAAGWVTGKVGGALSFDGINDYVDVGTVSSLDNLAQLTYAVWVKPDYLKTQFIIAKDHPTNYWHTSKTLLIVATSFQFDVKGDASLVKGTKWNTAVANQWQHVVVTWDGGTSASGVRIYIDGSEVESYRVSYDGAGLISDSGTNMRIGEREDGRFIFSGQMDEVRIYDRVLTPTEVMVLYNYAKEPIGHWAFDEESGAIASDSSVNGIDATVEGSAGWVTGKVGGALSFDGIEDYVDVGARDSLDNLGPLTYAVWVKPDFLQTQFIIAKDHPTNYWHTSKTLLIAATSFQFDVRGDDASLVKGTKWNAAVANQWQHVVVTWDGGTSASGVHIYIDGSEVESYRTSLDGVGLISDTGTNMRIGEREDGRYMFSGQMDEVRIYDSVLTPTEIMVLYNSANDS